jgi:hypothetical protein
MTDRRRIAAVARTDDPGAPSAGEGAPTPRPRIDPITRLLVLRLKDAEPERSAASIAAVVGDISEASVRRLLAGHTSDAKALTKALMQTTVADRLENWERACEVAAEKGYHQPAKDYLEAAQLTEPKPQVQTHVNVQPTIALSMNFGLGALKDYQPAQGAAIEATAVPVPRQRIDAPPESGAS